MKGVLGCDGLKCAAQHANIQLPSQRDCGNVHSEDFGFFWSLYLSCQVNMSWMSQRQAGHSQTQHPGWQFQQRKILEFSAFSTSSPWQAVPASKEANTAQHPHRTFNLSMLAMEEGLEYISSTKREQPRRGVHTNDLVPSNRPHPLLAAMGITGNWHCSTHSFTAYTRHSCTAALPLFWTYRKRIQRPQNEHCHNHAD